MAATQFGSGFTGALPIQSFGGVVTNGERYFVPTDMAFNPQAFAVLPGTGTAGGPSMIPTIATIGNTTNPTSVPTDNGSGSMRFAIAAVVILAIGLLGLNYIHFR